jgi:hypothetical protein
MSENTQHGSIARETPDLPKALLCIVRLALNEAYGHDLPSQSGPDD